MKLTPRWIAAGIVVASVLAFVITGYVAGQSDIPWVGWDATAFDHVAAIGMIAAVSQVILAGAIYFQMRIAEQQNTLSASVMATQDAVRKMDCALEAVTATAMASAILQSAHMRLAPLVEAGLTARDGGGPIAPVAAGLGTIDGVLAELEPYRQEAYASLFRLQVLAATDAESVIDEIDSFLRSVRGQRAAVVRLRRWLEVIISTPAVRERPPALDRIRASTADARSRCLDTIAETWRMGRASPSHVPSRILDIDREADGSMPWDGTDLRRRSRRSLTRLAWPRDPLRRSPHGLCSAVGLLPHYVSVRRISWRRTSDNELGLDTCIRSRRRESNEMIVWKTVKYRLGVDASRGEFIPKRNGHIWRLFEGRTRNPHAAVSIVADEEWLHAAVQQYTSRYRP